MPQADRRTLGRSLWESKLGSLALIVAAGAITACDSGGPVVVNLMPAPAVFENGAVDPFPEGRPPLTHGDFGLLYATDRKPSVDPDESLFYLDDPGFVVRLGSARIKAGAGLDWEEARRYSLSTDRTEDYPLQVHSVRETGVLDSTYSLLTRETGGPAPSDTTGKEFARLVDERLTRSGVNDVYVYVHGYRVVFDNAVLVSAELWHFLGYRGAFVAYAWPATPRALAYWSDLETAAAMSRKLRLFLTYVAENTQAERIHLIGFSAGSRVVVHALEQLALLNTDATEAEIRNDVRIGNVIIVGGDISRESFGAAAAEGMLRIPERLVVYVSSEDNALAWSRRMLRRSRIGEMWSEAPSPRIMEFMRRNPSLEFIDVTDAAGSTSGNGHGYFRNSPWVSSDVLALLAFDIDPDRRGLEKMADGLIWTFPPDYVERLRKALREFGPVSTL